MLLSKPRASYKSTSKTELISDSQTALDTSEAYSEDIQSIDETVKYQHFVTIGLNFQILG